MSEFCVFIDRNGKRRTVNLSHVIQAEMDSEGVFIIHLTDRSTFLIDEKNLGILRSHPDCTVYPPGREEEIKTINRTMDNL